jgi:hypothetical protein
MRQIDDAVIDAKLKELDDRFKSLLAQMKELDTEAMRVQGEFRVWSSFKGDEVGKTPTEQ